MVKVNTYFDGAVSSLSLSVGAGKATVGVMQPGTWSFTTGSPEIMRVITGSQDVRLPGGEWKTWTEGTEYHVPAQTTFEVRVEADSAYLCLF